MANKGKDKQGPTMTNKDKDKEGEAPITNMPESWPDLPMMHKDQEKDSKANKDKQGQGPTRTNTDNQGQAPITNARTKAPFM